VDYIALINLNSTLASPLGETQQELCHEALRELVLETRDFARLVGDARNDGTRQKGAIELRSKIIGLNDEDDFLRTITSQAAMQADEDDRISDAVLLYHLAEDYDTVVALVGKSLSESLASTEATEVYAGANPSLGLNAQGLPMNQSISLTSVEDPAELARNIIATYSKTSSIYAKVSKGNWEALGVLVNIAEAKKLYNEGRVEQCLKVWLSQFLSKIFENILYHDLDLFFVHVLSFTSFFPRVCSITNLGTPKFNFLFRLSKLWISSQ